MRHFADPLRLECLSETPDRLLAELAIFSLDVVLADAPAPPAVLQTIVGLMVFLAYATTPAVARPPSSHFTSSCRLFWSS